MGFHKSHFEVTLKPCVRPTHMMTYRRHEKILHVTIKITRKYIIDCAIHWSRLSMLKYRTN